jgi:chromosome segregation ATPase
MSESQSFAGYQDRKEQAEDLRPRTISGQIDRLGHLSQRLDEAIGVLEGTLEPILMKNDPETTESSRGKNEEMKTDWNNQSQFAEQLESLADRLERRLRQIQRLVGRVDF